MRMRNLILREMCAVGADAKILNRLFPHAKTALISWTLHRLRSESSGITTWLELVAAYTEYEYKYHQLKYAYFSIAPTPMVELERDRGFKEVYDTLVAEFGAQEFWDEALPFVFKDAKRLVAELMFERGSDPKDVAVKLNISNRLAYYIRKACTENYLYEKESNT